MPLISKFPKLPKKISAPKRQFLTKPTSWAKLGVLLLISALIVWFNLRPQKKASDIPVVPDNGGQVAGEETKREQENPVVPVIKDEPVETAQDSGPTKAQTAVERIIGKTDDLETLLKAGKKFLDEGNFDNAIIAFERTTEIVPDYRDTWYLLGYSYLKKYQQNPNLVVENGFSDIELARFALERAKTLDPQDKDTADLLEITNKLLGY